MSSPKLFIIETVLEGALDAGVEAYVAVCRRLLSANLRGWRKYADPKDWAMVLEAYGEMLAADYGGMDCDRIACDAEDAMASGDAVGGLWESVRKPLDFKEKYGSTPASKRSLPSALRF